MCVDRKTLLRCMVFGATAICCVTGSTRASPPPPPSPDLVATVDAASCGSQHDTPAPEAIPVKVSPLSPEPIVESVKGTVTWRWGYHLASGDSRVGNITGLTIDEKFGIIAMTANRHWLILDYGTKDGIAAVKAIGLAPMRGAPGRPTSIAFTLHWQLVSFPDQNIVQRYSLSTCGTAAVGLPVFTIAGQPPVTVLTEAAADYVALVGQDETGIKNTLMLPREQQTVTIRRHDIPALAGYRLVALANGTKIVPYIFALWATPGHNAVLQLMYVPLWGDFWGPNANTQTVPVKVAEFSRTPTGMTAFFNRKTGHTGMVLTFDTGPGSVDIVSIDIKQ